MIKQIIFILLLSVVILLTMPYAQHGVQYLVDIHTWISNALMQVFSGGTAGNLARGLLALLAVPVLVGLVPAIIYWLIKRRWFPYFMEFVWVTWLIEVTALVVLFKLT